MAATKNAQELKQETKSYITTALLRLLKTNKLYDIKISQVCQTAGVSRMAFYRNFDNLEQVLASYYQQKIELAFKNRRDLNFQYQFMTQFGDELIQAAQQGYEHIVRELFIKQVVALYGEDNYQTTFIVAGAYAAWRKWLLENRQLPLSELRQVLRKFHRMTMEDFNTQET